MEKLLTMLLENNGDKIVDIVKSYIEQYKPIVYGVLSELLKIYADYANNTELPTLIATQKRKYFDALRYVGFTDEQAMALLINSNLDRITIGEKLASSKGSKNSK